MRDYWHICTRGLEREVIFKSREDFVYGMNGVAVFSLMYDLRILAFCLMDNHVHFVVKGSRDACLRFIRYYKRRLSALADMTVADECLKEIGDEEYLRRVIAYVLRNPMSAGLDVLPLTYRWGSGALYFNSMYISQEMIPVQAVGKQMLRKILSSRVVLPETYRLTREMYVDPSCYVCYKEVEKLYRYPARMMFYLSRNEDMEMELESGLLGRQRYGDKELRGAVERMCREMFRSDSPEGLCVEDRYRLAARLRKKYGLSISQLARLTMSDRNILASVLLKRHPDPLRESKP